LGRSPLPASGLVSALKSNKRRIVKEQINRQQTLQEQVRIIIKDIIINASRAVLKTTSVVLKELEACGGRPRAAA
jgi:hypothetical protein